MGEFTWLPEVEPGSLDRQTIHPQNHWKFSRLCLPQNFHLVRSFGINGDKNLMIAIREKIFGRKALLQARAANDRIHNLLRRFQVAFHQHGWEKK